ncbi:MAG: hypothetical protein AB7I42_25155 [Bradyrhizobium sp.]|uniref:hypothetical protein n=1 Tax=Bradyrhizobium sp. TaxID=376 RepID=UPI003D12931E
MRGTINNIEAVEMMQRCKQEIMLLRAEVGRLQPKADAYDNIATVLRLLPRPGVSMAEDFVWVLDQRIRDLTPKPDEEGGNDD